MAEKAKAHLLRSPGAKRAACGLRSPRFTTLRTSETTCAKCKTTELFSATTIQEMVAPRRNRTES